MLYCGVDGGGTKTKVILANDYNIIGEAVTGPSSIDTVDINRSINNISIAINQVLNTYKVKDKIDSIFLGIGGVASNKHSELIISLIKKHKFLKEGAKVVCNNDIFNAYNASCSGRNNITLIIGTGSVGYGIDEEGKSHRSSGVHFLEGDFGSGYDLGVQALVKMSKAYDNRIESTEFTNFLLDKFKVNTFADLVSVFTYIKPNRTLTASLAKDVIEFAKKEDCHAISILDKASNSILEIIKAVDNNTNLQNREVGIVGSLGTVEPYYSMIVNKLKIYDLEINVHISEQDPVMGALIEAKRQV